MVRDIYEAISKAGIDVFEVGYLGADKPGVNMWKKCLPEDVSYVRKGLKGAEVCAMMDYKNIMFRI